MKKRYLITTFLVVMALLFSACDNPTSPETPDAGNGVDKTALATAITDAETLRDSVSVGTNAGNVSQEDYNAFDAAITAAKETESFENATQAEIDNAVTDLATATTVFNNSVLPFTIVSSTAGTVNFTSLIDTWGSGTVLDEPYTADNKYDSVIKATSGTNWNDAFCVAFMNIPANGLLRYTNLEFKVKSSDYSTVKVQMTGAEFAELQFNLADGTTLEGDWIQMSIPLSDFGTLALNQTQFGILEHSAGIIYIADVEFTGLKAIDASYLQGLITEAEALNAAHPEGSSHNNAPLAAKNTLYAAIANAQTIATAAASWDSLDAEIVVLTDAINAFKAEIIVLPPTSLASAPTLPAADVISLHTSNDTYTNINVAQWNPWWGQGGTLIDATVDSKTLKELYLVNYQGVDFSGDTQNISGKTTLHISIYTNDGNPFDVILVNGDGDSSAVSTGTLTPLAWNEVELDFSSISNTAGVIQLKFDSGSGFTYWLDNIYFH